MVRYIGNAAIMGNEVGNILNSINNCLTGENLQSLYIYTMRDQLLHLFYEGEIKFSLIEIEAG